MEPYAAAEEVWTGALVFARVGAVLLLLPGIGESYVPARIRLSFALLLALVLTPLVSAGLPSLPATVGGMAGWILREVATGLMIGSILRVFISAMATAGEVVSLQTTLSFAQTANPLQAQPGTTIGAFLTLLGVTLLFASDLHHLFIGALFDSYRLIAPAQPLLLGDFVQVAVRTTADAFILGVQLATPVIVFALVFNTAAGLVGRVMPQFQVFFASAPLNIILGLSVFTLSLGVLGTVFIERYREVVRVFSAG